MYYILYKSFLFTLASLNEFVYENLSRDITQLNWNYPIHSYCNEIPTQYQITNIYNMLGIIDYNYYIYNISSNTKNLHIILNNKPDLQAKVSSIVLSDIINQN